MDFKSGTAVNIYVDGTVISGLIYCTDPETKIIFLMRKVLDDFSIVSIMPSAILKMEEIPMEGLSEWIKEFNAIKPKEEEEFINKKENKVINEDAIQNQKSLIMEKLQEAKIPFEHSEKTIFVFGNQLRINSPFNYDNFICNNEIMLQRIHSLLHI